MTTLCMVYVVEKNKICGMVFGKVEELMRKAEKDGKDVDFLLIGWVILVSLW